MQAKKRLARALVTRFHSAAAAAAAQEDFEARFSQRDWNAADLPSFSPGRERGLLDVVCRAYAEAFGQNRTRSEVRRLIEQGSIQWQGEKLTDPKAVLPAAAGSILKLDKKRAVRLLD
jgi:tyrosyl-tRNA synthetase